MNARTIRMITAAAVLGGAGYAHAQTAPREGGWREPPSRPGATQPAPAPAPPTKQPGAAAQAPGTATSQLTDRQQQLLGTLHLRNLLSADAGQMATQRGTTPELRQLGEKLLADHTRLEQELAQLVTSRGGDVKALPTPESELARYNGLRQRLGSMTGAEFDREFVLAMRDVQQGYVEDLKQMRDNTPGKDAELKGWLDATENAAEEHLTATRQVKQALDAQRAAKR